MQALKSRFKATKHARIYLGDVRLARAVPVNRGRLKDPKAGCSVSSIYRAKLQLERLAILNVVHTKGGMTRNPAGEKVAAATGYEFHPELYFALADELARQRSQQKAAADELNDRESSPQQRMAARARQLAASFKNRAGP